jgi:hypothetical protein
LYGSNRLFSGQILRVEITDAAKRTEIDDAAGGDTGSTYAKITDRNAVAIIMILYM